eukprot:TRINITY_DN66967_c8_g1_i1.p1 TRINITY_DN66967_c8_g1~~TRINITY_DN66967_c8_g1_i1.p1  ORF type:complete len:183 (+),score=31.48 TRINITY_DN66967_c8_g1_i1:90-638(+)
MTTTFIRSTTSTTNPKQRFGYVRNNVPEPLILSHQLLLLALDEGDALLLVLDVERRADVVGLGGLDLLLALHLLGVVLVAMSRHHELFLEVLGESRQLHHELFLELLGESRQLCNLFGILLLFLLLAEVLLDLVNLGQQELLARLQFRNLVDVFTRRSLRFDTALGAIELMSSSLSACIVSL